MTAGGLRRRPFLVVVACITLRALKKLFIPLTWQGLSPSGSHPFEKKILEIFFYKLCWRRKSVVYFFCCCFTVTNTVIRKQEGKQKKTFASRQKWDVKEWGLDIRGLNAGMSLFAFLRVSDPFALLLSRSSNRAYG